MFEPVLTSVENPWLRSVILSPALLIQRDQAEVTQQLSSLQSKMRVSYGNDALMPDLPDSTTPLDTLPLEQDGLGFIHPESFNQANTDNHGKHLHTECCNWTDDF